jgi:hypothetical protein
MYSTESNLASRLASLTPSPRSVYRPTFQELKYPHRESEGLIIPHNVLVGELADLVNLLP